MGVTASSSSSPAGLRNGVRSLPSVAVSVLAPVARLELRNVLELEVVGPAMAAGARGTGAGGRLRKAPGSATIYGVFWRNSASAKTAAQSGRPHRPRLLEKLFTYLL